MFIHIGNEHIIRSRYIIAIIEYDVVSSSSIMEEMIEERKKNNTLKGSMSDAKSMIITEDAVYFSSLSVSTLKKYSSISAMLSKAEEYTEQLE